MKAIIKKINQVFISLVLAAFYLVFLAPSKLLRLVLAKRTKQKNSYWQKVYTSSSLNSAY